MFCFGPKSFQKKLGVQLGVVHMSSYRRMSVDVCYPTTHHAARETKQRSTLNLIRYDRLYHIQLRSLIKQRAFRNELARSRTEKSRLVPLMM